MLVCLTIIPAFVLYVICKPEEELKKEETIKKYSNVYEGLKLNSKPALMYNFLYVARRALFILIMFSTFFRERISI